MKTASKGSSPIPSTLTRASNDSVWRPKALRRTVMSIPPTVLWSSVPPRISSASMIMPAQVP